MSWMSPFPGDWHILMNFQEVVYFDTGLCNLALASGYPQNSVGVNFTRTLKGAGTTPTQIFTIIGFWLLGITNFFIGVCRAPTKGGS